MKYFRNGIVVEHPGPGMSTLPSGVPGAFETLLVREGQPVFWAEHWRRLAAGISAHALRAPFTADDLLAAAAAMITANGVRHGVLRYAMWCGPEASWQVEVSGPRTAMRKRDLRVTWGPRVEIPLAMRGFKHLSRTAWAAAAREAQANGFDQPLLSNAAGDVVEAATANLFLAQRGVLHTPSLDGGPLPGILRAHVIALARDAGVRVCERPIARTEVASADEVWLTNSLIGIRPVSALDSHPFGDNRPVLDQIRRTWIARHGWDPGAPVAE